MPACDASSRDGKNEEAIGVARAGKEHEVLAKGAAEELSRGGDGPERDDRKVRKRKDEERKKRMMEPRCLFKKGWGGESGKRERKPLTQGLPVFAGSEKRPFTTK